MIRRDFRVYVLSLPRCFSSATTGVLEKLGVNVIHTSEEPQRRKRMQEQHKKKLGEYVPNEHFYEITTNQFKSWQRVVNTPYSGCKVILPSGVSGMIWGMIRSRPSRIIIMNRNPEEIRQSQQAFYKGDEFNTPEQAEMRRAYFRTCMAQAEVTCERELDIEYMVLNARDLITNPGPTIEDIARFIDAPNDIDEAVESIDPTKYRFKIEDLVMDI
jgi:hypothetical protein